MNWAMLLREPIFFLLEWTRQEGRSVYLLCGRRVRVGWSSCPANSYQGKGQWNCFRLSPECSSGFTFHCFDFFLLLSLPILHILTWNPLCKDSGVGGSGTILTPVYMILGFVSPWYGTTWVKMCSFVKSFPWWRVRSPRFGRTSCPPVVLALLPIPR